MITDFEWQNSSGVGLWTGWFETHLQTGTHTEEL